MKRKRALMPREAVPLGDFFYTTILTSVTIPIAVKETGTTIKINRMMRQQQLKKCQYLFYFLFIFLWLPGVIVCDENNNGEINGYNQESVVSTTELDSASRGSKKLGAKCQTDAECGIQGSICHALRKTCQCTFGLTATNNNDKCGRVTGLNESCTFNEQCSISDNFSECRDGKCLCRFEWVAVLHLDGRVECKEFTSQGTKKYGDKCESTQECSFAGSVCDPKMKACQCSSELSVTNQIDKCGKVAAVNESCFFHEQCLELTQQTECRENRCICKHQLTPVGNKEGKIECKVVIEDPKSTRYINPAMIGALVAMALMFIIICVVLRLFSRARWRENRTIFNTPNPRLMNVSLLRDNKLLHGHERRGSKMSVRAPSRQPSMASLRPHSPNPSIGSRRGSRGSSNASGNSMRSSRSLNGTNGGGLHEQKPLNLAHVPESVTVEITEPKA